MPMDAKTSRICRMVVIVATVAVAGWSAVIAEVPLVLISAATGGFLFYLCRSRMEEVVVDERDERVSERAAKVAVESFAAASALVGVLFIAARDEHPGLMNVGFALAFSASALMILYSALYGYYNRRYGYEPCDEE